MLCCLSRFIQYVDVLFILFDFNKSFPKRRIITPVGVTTKKNTIPITIGETMRPKKIPNLNQSLFSGVNNLELITPKIRKIIDKTNDHNLISSSFFRGHKATIKNTAKNTNPKLLFDEPFILEFDVIINLICETIHAVNQCS